ncbi:hypothetical protein I2486_19520 [Cellulophaga sp. E16_2]|uniref:heavy metal-binding domain-containing protein n=1 Tax=Cellulophaga sp. E16_2 TaxID=2789297 RepID=UPI001A914D88|nr:heavy metal-binding domain-containing protein [Cellulophaga sp. E16_2]MBO0593594.1 hypothetical protein [Cellulophaga sp. E16_2]
MKFRVILLPIVICLVTLSIFTSCKNKKEEVKTDEISKIAEATYSCPMNCEDGKTYHEVGSCPVCKMDLMLVSTDSLVACEAHKDGKCTCEGDACTCENCKEHNGKMTCTIGDDGKCADENCKKHQKNKDCVMNKNGKCICESGKCTCVDCASKNK